MKLVDIYSLENPAFCSLALKAYVDAYELEAKSKVPYILLFILLPLVLNTGNLKSFSNTSAATGFYKWIGEHPEVLIGFPELVSGYKYITLDSLRFSIHYNLLSIDENGNIFCINNPPWKKTTWSNNEEAARIIKAAGRLGRWMGRVNNPSMVFGRFGIKP